jgi:phosphoglycolate phosphatase
MAFPFNVVAFDLDGTLADTAPDLTAALNHVLAEFGRPAIPAETVRNLVGHGARALIRNGLSATGGFTDALVEQGFPLFMDFYGRNICNGTAPYSGVEAAMDDLAEKGVALAMCTNKPESLALQLIDALGWQGRFKSIVGGDTLPVRKPDPAPLLKAIADAGGSAAAFVGDSITDADTARAASMPLVAVSFGFSGRPVTELGADAIIDHFDRLVPTLSSLQPR